MAEPHNTVARTTACTVVARNYLPAARILARSYLAQHPDHGFVIGLIDGDQGVAAAPAGHAGATEGYRIVGPEAFNIDPDDYLRMATAYSVTELATAVKPYLMRGLRADAEVVIYLDPDIRVFAPMPELVELAMTHQIVLTPHVLRPIPRDGMEPGEAVIMGTGVYNLGFLATGPGSEEFLDFWAERLRHDAIVAPEQQLFTDQRWVDLVPSLFTHHVLRDPGFNVAYWNTHERPVADDGVLTAGGKPLRFFHFSGYRPEKPWILSYHCARRPRTLLSENPVLRSLCDDYGAALREAGYAETLDAVAYGFATLADATRLTPMMRRLFRADWVAAEHPEPGTRFRKEVPPHGFGPDGGAAFRAWLAAPATPDQAAAGLNRLSLAVWESRVDLRLAFPRPCGPDAAGFRHWCQQSGPREGALPRWALPAEPAPRVEPVDQLGVNVVGYLTAELGLGEMARIVHEAIERAGVPIASVVEDRLLSNRTGVAAPETLGTPEFPVSLFCVNADQTAVVLERHPDAGHDRYRIGLWAWELADFPDWLHPAFGLVDEVWTVSEFCRKAIGKHATVPVRTIPVPVRLPDNPPVRERADGQPIRFLFAFDFNSIGDRKNPWGLVEAFKRAFGPREDVRLVIKAINGSLQSPTAERLRVAVAGDQRIELIERYLSVAELEELYATSDCYVSLHRSEGFGLTVAEAMARGLPVISTDYSSTTEFLDARTGWPVPHTLTTVGPNNHPYHEGAQWADPDLDAAAAAMREVADNPAEAAKRGAAARQHLARTRSMDAAATWMRDRLTAAYQAWQRRGSQPAAIAAAPIAAAPIAAVPVDHPLRPLRDSTEALRWRPEADAPSRMPLAPALRRAVLRAIDHYDVHQRQVLGHLMGGVGDTVGRLLARIESLESRLDRADQVLADKLDVIERTASGRTDQARAALAAELDLLRAATSDRLTIAENSVAELRDAFATQNQSTFDMFVERDRRADSDERTLSKVDRELAAVHAAAAMPHAPVPPGAEVVLCDAGALLVPRDDVVRPWLVFHRSWEIGEARLMSKLMAAAPTGSSFVDIGAHVGYHSLRLLRDNPGVGRVIAVEANPETVALLRRNIAVNLAAEVAGRVTVLPLAAWDTDTTVRLVHPKADNSGDHRVHEHGTAGIEVRAVALDGVPEVRAGTVGLIKVDLQGRDHRALAGLAEVLEADRPQVVCEFSPAAIEELGDDPEQVLLGYRKLGYRPAPLTEDGPVDGEHTDAELVAAARTGDTDFITLWLRPA
jgi:FkbM family methyltransferase